MKYQKRFVAKGVALSMLFAVSLSAGAESNEGTKKLKKEVTVSLCQFVPLACVGSRSNGGGNEIPPPKDPKNDRG